MTKKKSYRFDQRSEEEFKKDIKERTEIERSLFLRWLDCVEQETGNKLSYKDTGCGKNGDYLKDNEVSTEADFDVEGFGKLEVKFSKPLLTKQFHLKVRQVKSYAEQGASILMVNGADEDVPQFTILTADTLKEIIGDCKVVKWPGFGWKPAYRISVDRFIWRSLK
jgi:hypothetical protein